jgi:probable phosphoglycerate mutase
MGRCVETGAVIAEACGVAAEVCGDLNDIDYGAWQFKTFERAQKDDPVLFAAWFATPQCVRFPRGESLQDVAARAGNVVRFAHAWLPPADPIAMRFGRRALR